MMPADAETTPAASPSAAANPMAPGAREIQELFVVFIRFFVVSLTGLDLVCALTFLPNEHS
jgi:hypothetical protein